jgi:anti-sigma regulatory factor (Ser/Thr protein kinase)
MSVDDDDPEPFALDFDGRQVPPLVRVRQWLAGELVGLGDDHLSVVLLVCTELVTNVYDHAAGPCRIRLRRNRMPCWVRLEVGDSSPERPVVRNPVPGHPGGRGMRLVDALSDRWGVDTTEIGKTVWAHISCENSARGIARCPELVSQPPTR